MGFEVFFVGGVEVDDTLVGEGENAGGDVGDQVTVVRDERTLRVSGAAGYGSSVRRLFSKLCRFTITTVCERTILCFDSVEDRLYFVDLRLPLFACRGFYALNN